MGWRSSSKFNLIFMLMSLFSSAPALAPWTSNSAKRKSMHWSRNIRFRTLAWSIMRHSATISTTYSQTQPIHLVSSKTPGVQPPLMILKRKYSLPSSRPSRTKSSISEFWLSLSSKTTTEPKIATSQPSSSEECSKNWSWSHRLIQSSKELMLGDVLILSDIEVLEHWFQMDSFYSNCLSVFS